MDIKKTLVCTVITLIICSSFFACANIKKNNSSEPNETGSSKEPSITSFALSNDSFSSTEYLDNTIFSTQAKSSTNKSTYLEASTTSKHLSTEANLEIKAPPTLADRITWNISLSVKEVHAGDNLIYVDIADYDNQGFSIGISDFELERNENSKWVNITAPQIDAGRGDVFPKKDGVATITMRISVSRLSVEPLEEGRYRLTANLSGHRVSTEFDVLP